MLDDHETKRRFAIELRKTPRDPYRAAIAVIGNDPATALVISREWPNDPVVKQIDEDLDPNEGLPTKADVVRAAWEHVNEIKGHTFLAKETTGALKLVADLMGYIEKPEGGTVVNNDNRSVLVYRDHGTDAEWEAASVAQQAKLINDAAQS
jgi:hypothetical protein